METKIIITINGQTVAGLGVEKAPDKEDNTAAGCTIYSDDDKEMTEEEVERYEVASDLANVCDYLEDSEVIKIKLIIQKAQARKERAERG